MEKKKSAGQIVEEFNQKQQMGQLDPISPYELAKEGQFKDYESNLELIISHHRPLYGRDFYIEKRVQHEWGLNGAPRPVMKVRSSCPTPTHLQTVIKYHWKDEAIEYLWSIPAKWQFGKYKRNPFSLEKVGKKTLQDILAFEDGTLLLTAKKMNGEIERPSKLFTV